MRNDGQLLNKPYIVARIATGRDDTGEYNLYLCPVVSQLKLADKPAYRESDPPKYIGSVWYSQDAMDGIPAWAPSGERNARRSVERWTHATAQRGTRTKTGRILTQEESIHMQAFEKIFQIA